MTQKQLIEAVGLDRMGETEVRHFLNIYRDEFAKKTRILRKESSIALTGSLTYAVPTYAFEIIEVRQVTGSTEVTLARLGAEGYPGSIATRTSDTVWRRIPGGLLEVGLLGENTLTALTTTTDTLRVFYYATPAPFTVDLTEVDELPSPYDEAAMWRLKEMIAVSTPVVDREFAAYCFSRYQGLIRDAKIEARRRGVSGMSVALHEV